MLKYITLLGINIILGSLAFGENGKIFIANIDEKTINNKHFRMTLFTTSHSQLVVMSLKPGEDIGKETHNVDQFFRIEKGDGKVIVNNIQYDIHKDSAFIIPAKTEHNVVNSGKSDLKLYTIYSPPQHPDGTTHRTKADAQAESR